MLPLVIIAVLGTASSAAAQAPGLASFRVSEKGMPIGTVEMTLNATDDGWRLHGTSRLTGSVPVTIVNLDLLYDESWNGRFMTMEMKAPDDAIVHVAVVGDTTRTDIVRSTEARFRANSVSRDTIFLPDRAYGAYEAVAVRLTELAAGLDLPLFIVPIGETRAIIDSIATEQVRTSRGPLQVAHYVLTEIRDRPTRVEVWVDRGRLLRLELPRENIALVRSDVLPESR
jgi:hypothetical protein